MQTINNEGKVFEEFIIHELHNLFEVPRQIDFLLQNQSPAQESLINEQITYLKKILKDNHQFINICIINPENKQYHLKGSIPYSGGDSASLSLINPQTLRYKKRTKNGYTTLYDIDLSEINHHINENLHGVEKEFYIVTASKTIFISNTPSVLGQPFSSDYAYNWHTDFIGEGFPLHIYINFHKNIIDKNNETTTVFLYVISASALLMILLLHRLYLYNINIEQDKREIITKQNQRLIIENERHLKENALLQLQQIKSQINPHFLFNCLNSLKALIDLGDSKATQFIINLSKVYRYILLSQNEGLIPLSEEMKFVNDYFYLQKIRFGDAINLTVHGSIPHGFIPFLALQTLIENAIKHNVISKHNPLTIEIVCRAKSLTVKNKISMIDKKSAESHGIGLAYLKNSYTYYNCNDFNYYTEQNFFIVKLPLIDKNR